MMDKAGIERIRITNEVRGQGAYRFRESAIMQPAANVVYRQLFGPHLLYGERELTCKFDDFTAGYDYQYGTDVFLNYQSGMQETLQEKFLTTTFDTVTVEHWQDWRTHEPGDWYKLRVDWYFVGYYTLGKPGFDCWILLKWPAVKQATNRDRIPWKERYNQRDGARSSFRYVPFNAIPSDCIYEWRPRLPPDARQSSVWDTLL